MRSRCHNQAEEAPRGGRKKKKEKKKEEEATRRKQPASAQGTAADHQKPGRRGPVWGGMARSVHLPPRLEEATLSSGDATV